MALTPEEIEQHTFRERFRGYDPDEVDAFLDRVVSALRTLEQERDAAVAERDRAQAGAGESEELLRRTLVSAQRTAEQTVAEANADADRIRGRAQERAAQILSEARTQAHDVADAVEELVGVHEQLRQSLRSLLAEHAERVEQGGQLPPAADLAARLRELADQAVAEGDAAEAAAAPGEAEAAGDGPAPEGWPEPPGAWDEQGEPPAHEPPGSYPPPPR